MDSRKRKPYRLPCRSSRGLRPPGRYRKTCRRQPYCFTKIIDGLDFVRRGIRQVQTGEDAEGDFFAVIKGVGLGKRGQAVL